LIGFVVNSKVKRFIKSQRNEKTLVTKKFLQALEAETERIVDLSVNRLPDGGILSLVAPAPIFNGTSLVCNTCIKKRIRELNPKIQVSKVFITSVNSYVINIIASSVRDIQGSYLQNVITDNEPEKVDIAPDAVVLKDTNISIDSSAGWDHIRVSYELGVQNATLLCYKQLFTAKTTKKIEEAVASMAKTYLHLMGILDDFTVKITKIERRKKGNTNGKIKK